MVSPLCSCKYDEQGDKLVVWKSNGQKMLPDDLYSRIDSSEPKESSITSKHLKTKLKIGDLIYGIDLLKIPYLSSFVGFQRSSQIQTSELIHNAISFFDIALKVSSRVTILVFALCRLLFLNIMLFVKHMTFLWWM